ncbi:hypothetical protein [Pseudomonas sp. P97.38]|uniref:hypothetical protein n=1 Tax=Pseudomonas sp. P97.38 TaxID=255451 RepID=UPI00069DB54F|nr:hypothetical protein [Pseudomonas sp. P97.38]
MNLEAFVERLNNKEALANHSEIINALQQLATDRTLFSNHLHATIQRDGFDIRNSLYNAYGHVLYNDEAFTVRLSFWSPVNTDDERETFIYNVNHNHDFDLYTVGYSGDGYTTLIREILDDLPLQTGRRPRLGKVRTFKLAPGEALYMPALRDVHRQLPPQTLSASLSLLVHPPHRVMADQAWCFDQHYRPLYPGVAAHETALFTDTLSLLDAGSPLFGHCEKRRKSCTT